MNEINELLNERNSLLEIYFSNLKDENYDVVDLYNKKHIVVDAKIVIAFDFLDWRTLDNDTRQKFFRILCNLAPHKRKSSY